MLTGEAMSDIKPKGFAGGVPVYCSFDAIEPIVKVIPNPRNPNQHPENQIELLAKIVASQGWRSPITVSRRSGFVVRGHGRIMAAVKLGVSEVPVDFQDYRNEGEEWADLIADNRIAELSSNDRGLLKDILEELDDGAFDMDLTGFDDSALEELMTAAPPEPVAGQGDPDEVPEPPKEAITKHGDLWLLGRHRLLCGDSTSGTAVERLLNGVKADAVVTSPPYTDQREYGIGKFDWLSLMNGAFDQMTTHLATEGHIIINLGPSHKERRVDRYWDPWLEYAESLGWPLYGWYVWDKGSGMPGAWNGRLAPAHEFVFHFTRSGDSANKWVDKKEASIGIHGGTFRNPDGSLSMRISPEAGLQPSKVPDSVIRINREKGNKTGHPAVFPVDFADFLIKTWTSDGQNIFEPFGGSGSTLIACEKNGRSAFLMELNPKYCDVIVERWEKFTGQKAQRPE